MSENPKQADESDFYDRAIDHGGDEFEFQGEMIDAINDKLQQIEHAGFFIVTDEGTRAHVLGDPNMPPETQEALKRLVDHTKQLLDSGWVPDEDDFDDTPSHELCPRCNGTGLGWDDTTCAKCNGMGYKWWL